MSSFNVIVEDINARKFIPYDVMPYLIDKYKSAKNKPKTFKECKEFIDNAARYMYWSRCEYEVVLQGWPNSGLQKKIDVYYQMKMNLDIITDLLMKDLNIK